MQDIERQGSPRPSDRADDTSGYVWLRFQAALVAPFLDDESRHLYVDEGWALTTNVPTARAALTRMLACTFERLTSLGDPWYALSPDAIGARLGDTSIGPSRRALGEHLEHASRGFDAQYETSPAPTVGALRAAGAIACALQSGDRPREDTGRPPNGVPERLAFLHDMVSWWALSSAAHRLSTDPVVIPLHRWNTRPQDLYDRGIWSPQWSFVPDDLTRAIRMFWARIGAYDAEVDWVAEATDAAWIAWQLATSDL